MSVGEDMAEARCRAGLTVTQVSEKTRIREAIIRGIERDDHSLCGGDFYVRGHVRAIARAVGADPGPLLAEYDVARRDTPPVTAAELFRPVRPLKVRGRRRAAWPAVLGLAVAAAVGIAGYEVIPGVLHHGRAATVAAAGHHRAGPAAHRPHRRAPRAPPPGATAVPGQHQAGPVTVRLTAIGDCWVEFTSPRGGDLTQLVVDGGTSRRWVFRRTIDMRVGNPRGIRLLVDGKNPLPPGPRPVTLRLGSHGKVSVIAR